MGEVLSSQELFITGGLVGEGKGIGVTVNEGNSACALPLCVCPGWHYCFVSSVASLSHSGPLVQGYLL